MLEPCLLQPCFHVAGSRPPVMNIIIDRRGQGGDGGRAETVLPGPGPLATVSRADVKKQAHTS